MACSEKWPYGDDRFDAWDPIATAIVHAHIAEDWDRVAVLRAEQEAFWARSGWSSEEYFAAVTASILAKLA